MLTLRFPSALVKPSKADAPPRRDSRRPPPPPICPDCRGRLWHFCGESYCPGCTRYAPTKGA
jgi:hypothetical protein